MRRLALYGAGGQSINMERIVTALDGEIEMPYLIENKAFGKIGTYMKSADGERALEVISLEHFVSLYEKKELDGFIVPSGYHVFDVREIRNIAAEHGISEENIYSIPFNTVEASKEKITDYYGGLMKLSEIRRIYHLDVHLVDHCNLKCKACSHFAPLVKGEVMVDVDEYRHNMERLRQLVPNINRMALLGGEPLLHPDLGTLIQITRDNFPYTKITLVTNGILLENMSDALVETIRSCNVFVGVSLYPPMHRKVDAFINYFKKNGLKYQILKIDKFERKIFQKACVNGAEMTQNCGHIMALRGSRIGRCVTALFTDYYNNAFEEKLPVDLGFDIYDDITGLELIEKLEQPLELCSQCCARDHYYEVWEAAGENSMSSDWFLYLPGEERA